MTFRYVTGNLINASTLLSVTSEHAIYVKENLYNQRPSYTHQFTAKTGNQILIDLGAPTLVTFGGVFNHNLFAPTKFKLKAAAANPPGGGNWDIPDWSDDFPVNTEPNNSYLLLSQTYRYWLLDIDDATNPLNTEVGEFIIGTHSNFGSGFGVRAESDGIVINVASHITHYGQPHAVKNSDQKKWDLQIMMSTTKGQIDGLETFLRDLGGAAGEFVMIENDTYDPCYYVMAQGQEFMAPQTFHSQTDIRTWSIPIIEHPRGIVKV